MTPYRAIKYCPYFKEVGNERSETFQGQPAVPLGTQHNFLILNPLNFYSEESHLLNFLNQRCKALLDRCKGKFTLVFLNKVQN